MATINFIWNGKDTLSALSGPAFETGATNGAFDPGPYRETWTGTSLTYGSGSAHPTGGTLNSWLFFLRGATFAFSVKDLAYSIPAGTSYSGLIAGLFAGRDEWHGTAEDNFFYWSVGNDTYHGGAGIDTIDSLGYSKSVLIGSKPSFTRVGGVFKVEAIGDLDITLDSVERLRFGDVNVALDLDGHAGAAARIAGAVFGREVLKDKELMGVAIGLLDLGLTPLELTGAALRAKLGNNYTNAQLVDLVYRNVVHTAPSAQEAQAYQSMLDKGEATGSELAWMAAESALNASSIDLTGLSKSGLDYFPWEG